MPSLTFNIKFARNTGLLFSAQEIRQNFLYGVQMSSSLTGQAALKFSDEDIEFYVQAAQKEIENYLNIKLVRKIYWEKLSFSNDDWRTWGFIKTTYPVLCPLRLEGFLNTTKTATYPQEWLSNKQDSDDQEYHRSIYLVPAGNTGAVTNSVIFAGILPNLGYLNAGMIPQYWTPHYVTGFDPIPADIIQIVGQLVTIQLLTIAAMNILGIPGATSTSLSIDGLSQNISAQNAFGAQIKLYQDSFNSKLAMLQGKHRGFIWGAC